MSVRQVTPNKVDAALSLGASVNSSAIDARDYDDISIQLNFTGTPTGTFAIQGSLDQTNWISAILSPTPSAGGAASQIMIELVENTMPFLRVAYTRTSGTGSLDVWTFGKGR